MSFLVKLPAERYSSTAFDGFVGSSDLELGDAKAMAWMCQLAYETDEPGKIKDIRIVRTVTGGRTVYQT